MTEPVRRCYALGGMEALAAFTPRWLQVCGPRVAVLSCQYSERYADHYRRLWPSVEVRLVAPDGSHSDVQAALAWASALYVAGGNTRRYWQLYGQEPVRSLIRQRYEAGMPYAGLSAGALLAMERCLIPAQDTGEQSHFVQGLGLVLDTLLGVHFTAWGGAATLQPLRGMWPEAQVLGLADHVTAYFENDYLAAQWGGTVQTL